MALTYKIKYKNHCTPQEQLLANGRWYLDSDCGRKMTGTTETSVVLSATGVFTTGVDITTSAISIASTKDFVYIKNTGSTEVVISLAGTTSAKYVIALAGGEAFASEISLSANVRVKTLSGTSTIEHFSET